MQHSSIDSYYKDLCQLNPVVDRLTQMARGSGENHWEKSKAVKELGLELEMVQYSLLVQGVCRTLEYENSKPTAIVEYRITFAIGNDPNSNIKYTMVINRNFPKFSETCRFYDQLFYKSPNSMELENYVRGFCSGKHANKHWCLRCNGEFNIPNIIQQLMVESISFQNIPKESLLHIEKILAPINENNIAEAARVAKLEEERIVQLQSSIAGSSAKLKSLVEEYMNALARDKECLQNLLATRGSIDLNKKEVADLTKKNKLLELKNKKEKIQKEQAKNKEENEKLQAKIQKEQSDMQQRQTNLDKEMEELDRKLKTLGE